MPDWTKSMQQTFEYCLVDPGTWKDVSVINTVTSSTIKRDAGAETLGSASMEVTEPFGESYVRIYLVTVQDGVREKIPLGTYLMQNPDTKFNGKVKTMPLDGYTPLIELKEKLPPIGYTAARSLNLMEAAYRACRQNVRAPVVEPTCAYTLETDFVAGSGDTWLKFLTDLIANAGYHFDLDETGKILFAPDQDTASLTPVWTYTDDNSSILYPDIDLDHDIFGIPNVVEVVYSKGSAAPCCGTAVNDDPNSPTSTVSRGRKIFHRVTNPTFTGTPTQAQIDEYAANVLREKSCLEYTISYSHGYCPVRVGDCVRINYGRLGIGAVTARVTGQSIECKTGCKVTETAVYTTNLWRG